jgi:hypothetical protein
MATDTDHRIGGIVPESVMPQLRCRDATGRYKFPAGACPKSSLPVAFVLNELQVLAIRDSILANRKRIEIDIVD